VTSDLSRNTEFDEFDTQFCPVTWVVTFIPNNKKKKYQNKNRKHTHTHTHVTAERHTL